MEEKFGAFFKKETSKQFGGKLENFEELIDTESLNFSILNRETV